MAQAASDLGVSVHALEEVEQPARRGARLNSLVAHILVDIECRLILKWTFESVSFERNKRNPLREAKAWSVGPFL